MKEYKDIYKGKKSLTKLILDYYKKNINNKSIINIETGFEIKFDYFGGRKSAYGSSIKANSNVDSRLTSEKATVIRHLPQILKEAKYEGNAKPNGNKKQHKKVKVFMYFSNVIKINNKIKKYRFIVRLLDDDKGRFHYSIEEIL